MLEKQSGWFIDALPLERSSAFNMCLFRHKLLKDRKEKERKRKNKKEFKDRGWERKWYVGIFLLPARARATLSPDNLDLLFLALQQQLCHIGSAFAYQSHCTDLTPASSVLSTKDITATGLIEQLQNIGNNQFLGGGGQGKGRIDDQNMISLLSSDHKWKEYCWAAHGAGCSKVAELMACWILKRKMSRHHPSENVEEPVSLLRALLTWCYA